ncbi:MAG: phytanoyl-CoA dioxygenase family protein [Planctomycetes bacterium]|nr:phytanoyl-CoA dioxygenase family protein [Planctomycetota bacterium]
MNHLTPDQLATYRRDGFVLIPGVFSHAECDSFVQHMMDLHAGREKIAGFEPRDPNNWGRTFNQHLYDPLAMNLLIDPRLRGYLEDACGGAVDAVQTMYFWVGSQQGRHQDQYYLPDCFSAWIAMTEVGPENGTIYVQPGSNRGRLLTMEDFRKPNGELSPMFGDHYNGAVDKLYVTNGAPEVPVIASKGDFVLFDGKLIHRGGTILKPGSFRHVMANHYIPHASTKWQYQEWPRIAFDGSRRVANHVPAVTT